MDNSPNSGGPSVDNPSNTDGTTNNVVGGATLHRGRSKVWNEFVITGDGTKVACKRCGDLLSYSHSHSTSSMLKHLKRKHRMDLYPPMEESEGGEGNIPVKTPEKVKQPRKASKSKKSATPEIKPEIIVPEYQEEHILDPSIQHDPLVFVDPCVRMRWADHSETFLKTFSVMYDDESYTDCILVAEKQFFKGHRMVLSSASELLDDMFKMTPPQQQPIIFLNNVKAMELRVLLDFIYKGEVAIPPNLIPSLVKIGSELKVKGLSDFVWNEDLASTIFPQGYSSNTNGMSQSNSFTPVTHYSQPVSCEKSLGCETYTNTKPLFTPVSQRYTYVQSHSPQPTTPTSGVPKTYGRLVSTTSCSEDILSHDQNLGVCEPNLKRMKLINSNSIPTTTSSPFLKSSQNVPDTVLMVTNQGDTMLSTSHGGVTLMTPNSLSLPVSFAIKESQSQGGHCHHSHQFVSGQPLTILSDTAHGLEEVVYSITEVPGGGHEVLMSGSMPSMDQGTPIVVYDANVQEQAQDKKLFSDDLSKS